MDIAAILKMIDQGRDSYEARLAVAQAQLKLGDTDEALIHLNRACELAPAKTMAWQLLGQAYRDQGNSIKAKEAWTEGIAVASANGDEQAKKVMQVWLARL